MTHSRTIALREIRPMNSWSGVNFGWLIATWIEHATFWSGVKWAAIAPVDWSRRESNTQPSDLFFFCLKCHLFNRWKGFKMIHWDSDDKNKVSKNRVKLDHNKKWICIEREACGPILQLGFSEWHFREHDRKKTQKNQRRRVAQSSSSSDTGGTRRFFRFFQVAVM